MMAHKFDLGQLVATPGALDLLGRLGISPTDYLSRHAQGDWGDLCADDKALNEQALHDGSRLFSYYNLPNNEKIYIITEAIGDNQRREVTTILRPDEY